MTDKPYRILVVGSSFRRWQLEALCQLQAYGRVELVYENEHAVRPELDWLVYDEVGAFSKVQFAHEDFAEIQNRATRRRHKFARRTHTEGWNKNES